MLKTEFIFVQTEKGVRHWHLFLSKSKGFCQYHEYSNENALVPFIFQAIY